jgi:hypothetical protein
MLRSVMTLAAAFVLLAAQAAAEPCTPPQGEASPVARVTAPGALVLGDGREIMIAGAAEKAGGAGYSDVIIRLVGSGPVRLSLIGRPDRWGRAEAHVWLADGTLLAARLIEEGAAIRAPGFAEAACAAHLDGLEGPIGPLRLSDEALGQAVRVEAQVSAQRRSGTRVYLDLVAPGTRRLTATLRTKDFDALAKNSGADWTRQTLRLRGRLEWWSGPIIVVDAPFDVALR